MEGTKARLQVLAGGASDTERYYKTIMLTRCAGEKYHCIGLRQSGAVQRCQREVQRANRLCSQGLHTCASIRGPTRAYGCICIDPYIYLPAPAFRTRSYDGDNCV